MKNIFGVRLMVCLFVSPQEVVAQENPMPTGLPMPSFTLAMRPDVCQEIKFSKDQQTQLMTKLQGMQQMGMPMPMPGGGMSGGPQLFEKLQAEMKPIFSPQQWSHDQAAAACQKIVALLTKEQIAKFQAMQGQKFKFKN